MFFDTAKSKKGTATPVIRAIQLKRQFEDASKQHFGNREPTAAEQEEFRRTFLADKVETLPTPPPAVDDKPSAWVQRLDKFFDPQDPTNSLIRPSSVVGKSRTTPERDLAPPAVEPPTVKPPRVPSPRPVLAPLLVPGEAAPPAPPAAPPAPPAAPPAPPVPAEEPTTLSSSLLWPFSAAFGGGGAAAAAAAAEPLPPPADDDADGRRPRTPHGTVLWPFYDPTAVDQGAEPVPPPVEEGSHPTAVPEPEATSILGFFNMDRFIPATLAPQPEPQPQPPGSELGEHPNGHRVKAEPSGPLSFFTSMGIPSPGDDDGRAHKQPPPPPQQQQQPALEDPAEASGPLSFLTTLGIPYPGTPTTAASSTAAPVPPTLAPRGPSGGDAADQAMLALIDRLQKEKDEADAAVRAAQARLDADASTCAELRARVASAEMRAQQSSNAMQSRREADEAEIARLRRDLQEAERSADLLRRVAQDLSAQAQSSQDAAAQAQRVLDEARLATDANAIRVAKATIASLRADLAETHSIRLRQQQELDMVKAEKDRLTLAVSDAALNQRVRTLQMENTALLRQAESMNQSIEALKAQLGRAHANEAQAQAQVRAQSGRFDAVDAQDRQRLAYLQRVNDILLQISRDKQFQQDLKRPLVRVALACWGGGPAAQAVSDKQREQARVDEGVARVFPVLKEFEALCTEASIRFPMEDIQASRPQLSVQSVIGAYGSEFVSKHGLTAPVAPPREQPSTVYGTNIAYGTHLA